MKKFLIFFLLISFCRLGFAKPLTAGDSSLVFSDDPVAAMLDSLARLKIFEPNIKQTPKPSKYKFAPDSVPRYSEAFYAAALEKLDVHSPFDLEYNSIVKGYIEMYVIRKRELVSRLMALSQYYFPMFEEQLDKYNLPLELKYLAICESALNAHARSRVGATGLWQFMYPTGKLYGLNVTSYVDERSDPYKSTVAACEYMKALYRIFGDWQMVLAAYNSGPGTVNKAIRRSGGKRTYWEIRPYLPRETQGYVPAFIAVNYVMNHTAEHNIQSAVVKKWMHRTDTIGVKQQIAFSQIANVLNMPVEEIKALNPCYKRDVIPYSPDKQYTLCLPVEKVGSFINNEAVLYNYFKKDTLTVQSLLASQETMRIHKVRSGEKLSTIARKYKVTVAEIKDWNRLRSVSVKPGQRLTIYETKPSTSQIAAAPAKAEAKKPAVLTASADNKPAKYKYYTIKKGDTLSHIAERNGLSLTELKKLNNIDSKHKLIPGKKLKVAVLTT